MKDDDKVVHVVFNPSEQPEADKISFALEDLIEYDRTQYKQWVEDFLTLGYDEFTAFKLAKTMCISDTKYIM
jgi:hypothetical protein